jgi:hypothetical protein
MAWFNLPEYPKKGGGNFCLKEDGTVTKR